MNRFHFRIVPWRERVSLTLLTLLALFGGGVWTVARLSSAVPPNGCTKVESPGADVSGDVSGATAGSVICLSAGSYAGVTVNNLTPTNYVTLESEPGATATVDGVTTSGNVSYLRVQGLKLTDPISTYSDGHDLQFLNNEIGNTDSGIILRGVNAPITNVLVQGNYFHDLDLPGMCANNSGGYAGGQGVTLYDADGVTIQDNTFQRLGAHYIQGGGDTLGVVVNHNIFTGPQPADTVPCAHLNVWQIWSGGNDDWFGNNVVAGTSTTSPVAGNSLMFETGPGGGTCSDSMSNTTVINNLFQGDGAYAMQILKTDNLNVTNNTVVSASYGIMLDRTMACGPGTNMNVERNLVTNNTDGSQNFVFGACTGTCTWASNASQDDSANLMGTGNTTNWSPKWSDTSWDPNSGAPPTDYYQPVGLPSGIGYQPTQLATPPSDWGYQGTPVSTSPPTPTAIPTGTPTPISTATPSPTSTPTANPTPAPTPQGGPKPASAVLVGSDTVQPSADNDAAGLAEALQYTASATGTARTLSLYIDAGSAAKSVVVGLYADGGGKPGALLTQGTITSPQAAAWNTVSVSAAQVSAGTKYWLALLGVGGRVNFRDVASGAGPTQNSAQANLSGLPSTWGSGANWANSPASFYAGVSPAGSIFSLTAVPATVDSNDARAVELGVKFRSDAATTVAGVRFYKSADNTGAHTGSLWTASGTRLATVTFASESASGWQTALFATPVAIAANTTYIVSYHTAVGHYSDSSEFFANNGVDSGSLYALSNSAAGGNGVYAYGAGGFPNQTYKSTNYWVDVVTA